MAKSHRTMDKNFRHADPNGGPSSLVGTTGCSSFACAARDFSSGGHSGTARSSHGTSSSFPRVDHRIPIGVDSFIMISAYLMTSSFLRRSENGTMPRFLERWGNTFKRLLPPLVVTVLVTLGASLMILPVDRWKETTVEAFASITYWENWRLVEVAANYYANDSALSSPLQHLWSMSMQGQIFLLWPLLMTLCVLAARRMNMSIRGAVAVAFGALTVPSLV